MRSGARALSLTLLALGCTAEVESTRASRSAVVQGADDRKEYFETEDEPTRTRFLESAVALVPNSRLVRLGGGAVRVDAPSLAEAEDLCPGEPFADQPAAAFCSAVLLDWDLLLTAGHCARVLAPGDFSAVFGYFYRAPGELLVTENDIVAVEAIATEALSAASHVPRYDFAWLRLARRVRPPYAPAPVHVRDPVLEVGEPLVALSAVGGVPLKADAGGTVRDARAPSLDYFLADTDTCHGSSGGGAFDTRGVLLGVLARGGTDFTTTAAGCATTRVVTDGAATEEQFSYAHSALLALCSADPGASSLCRAECEAACSALPAVSEPGVDEPGADERDRGGAGAGASCALNGRAGVLPARDGRQGSLAVLVLWIASRRVVRAQRRSATCDSRLRASATRATSL